MTVLFLLAFTLTLFFLYRRRQSTIILKALPAYVPKKRLPKGRKIPIPDYIPNFYY